MLSPSKVLTVAMVIRSLFLGTISVNGFNTGQARVVSRNDGEFPTTLGELEHKVSKTRLPLYEKGRYNYMNSSARLTNYAKVCLDNPDILVYNRINKAGSSTTMDITKRLSKINNFTILMPTQYYDHKKLRQALFSAIESGKRTVIMNYFNFPEFIYSNKVSYINMMRDPVERFISEYYYARSLGRGRNGEQYRAAHGNLSLEESIFGQSYFTGHCLGKFNVMAHYFCGMESSLCHTNDTWLHELS